MRNLNKQFLIIDGYNLLHSCGFIDGSAGPGMLERARNLLVGILVRHLSDSERSRTTLVFDSRRTELSAHQSSHHLLVEFAVDHEDADAHIELLIRKHSAPKQLVVVSSDHRLHKAARARGATAIDSDQWLEELTSGAKKTTPAGPPPGDEEAQLPRDVAYWMKELDIADEDLAALAGEDSQTASRWNSPQPSGSNRADSRDDRRTDGDRPASGSRASRDASPDVEDVHDSRDWGDIFPPGYADDLLDTDD